MRSVVVAGLVGAGLLGATSTAHAGCAPPLLKESIDTGGVVVHYTTAPESSNAITLAQAQTLAVNAQGALTDEVTKLGMPPPVPDSDGKLDVYAGTTAGCVLEGPAAVTVARHPDQPISDAYVVVEKGSVTDRQAIAHELFHTMQLALHVGGRRTIREGTAEWAAHHLYPGQGVTREYDPGLPLDCGDAACGQTPYDVWPFFEYLSQRYGTNIGLRIFQAYGSVDNAAPVTQVLDAVLGPLGTTTANAYRDFAGALIAERIANPELRDTGALAIGNGFQTGVRPRVVPSKSYTLEHLSARFLDLFASDSESGPRCRPGRLILTIRAGGGAAAFLRIKKATTPLVFRSATAKTTVSWPLCASSEGTLALVNASPGGPAMTFKVSMTLKRQRT